MTQVPPTRYSSAIITRAPWFAAMRAARTPPEPAPMTKRSTSSPAMLRPASRLSPRRSDRVTLLLHLFANASDDLLGKLRAPLARGGKALLQHLGKLRNQLLAGRRVVEGEN